MRVLYIEPDREWQGLVRDVVRQVFPRARVTCVGHPRRARFPAKAIPDIVIVAGFTRHITVVLSRVIPAIRTRVGSRRLIIVISSGLYTEEDVKGWGADHLCSRTDVTQRLPGLLRGDA